MNILVTGGLGYIGSHISIELLKKNFNVVIIDNLSNTSLKVYENIKLLAKNLKYEKDILFFNADVRDKQELEKIFNKFIFDAVVHLAGLKSVSESVNDPLSYYDNNLQGSLNILECIAKNNINKFIFSSSATVYGKPKECPIKEDQEVCAVNPYGETKLFVEKIMSSISKKFPEKSFISLRYFNPIGAHKSGLIGDRPSGVPNNLMPYITQVASGSRKELSIFGKDYNTHDGTGVRDYIHVVDLARGHVNALMYSENLVGYNSINLGTGEGYSVLDIVRKFEEVNQISIPYVFSERRDGDIDECYANADLAKTLINWESKLGLAEMCKDSWNFEKRKK